MNVLVYCNLGGLHQTMPFMTVCYNLRDYSFCLPVVFFLQNDVLETARNTCFHI